MYHEADDDDDDDDDEPAPITTQEFENDGYEDDVYEEDPYAVTVDTVALASRGKKDCDKVDPGQLKSNVVKIQLFYGALSYERYSETAKTSSTQLLSGIAGLTGLWLGFSISTLLEWVEFLAVLAIRRPKISRD